MRPVMVGCVLTVLVSVAGAQPPRKLVPADAPAFELRARVRTVQGRPPGERKFTFRLGGGKGTVTTLGDAWSDWLPFGEKEIEATLSTYPATYLRGYPVVTGLTVSPVADPTRVEAELKFAGTGEVFRLEGELFGPRLGVLVWREDGKPRAATMAGYNRRYWKVLEQVRLDEESRPKHFPIVDRFIGGDSDRTAWREGIEQLGRAGFSAIMLPPTKETRSLLLATGRRRTSWAVYSPPGYAFAFDEKVTPGAVEDWARKQAQPYLDAGYKREDMALFAMSDEPGWYYPRSLETLKASAAGLGRFRAYLKGQGLTPADVGAAGWEEVLPLGRSRAKDLPSRRLFYWSMRFFAYDSARHFADCTRALERAFYPGVPVFTNWNFFSGRLYVPGPVANNPDRTSPDAAMGGHDWLELGRLRGGTMLWTEDWFGDGKAYQWSFYCSKLRSAAARGGVQFGGYVIPRTAGDREDGILQKILCVVGSGGKAIKYFVFGPEYSFPGNCYSERAAVLPKMAEAHGMIGRAEDLLWPGTRPRPEVAILAPRSAQLWDAKDVAVPRVISDATNNNLNAATADYLAEVFDLYLALQHANVPVDFVEEEDLGPAGLKPYRVLYVTEPNVPAESQRGLVEWVKGGGTLVTVSGAATHDRYDEPCGILGEGTGIREKPRERLLGNIQGLKPAGRGEGGEGPFEAIGVKGSLESEGGEVLARFEDGAPAVVRSAVGKGRHLHFAWLPGLSYWKSAGGVKDRLPVGFSEPLRRWITLGPRLAGVRPPVEAGVPLVETPLLLSGKGAAITVLNWTGDPVGALELTVRVPFAVGSVESVKQGKLSFTKTGEGVRLTLPVKAADIVMLRP